METKNTTKPQGFEALRAREKMRGTEQNMATKMSFGELRAAASSFATPQEDSELPTVGEYYDQRIEAAKERGIYGKEGVETDIDALKKLNEAEEQEEERARISEDRKAESRRASLAVNAEDIASPTVSDLHRNHIQATDINRKDGRYGTWHDAYNNAMHNAKSKYGEITAYNVEQYADEATNQILGWLKKDSDGLIVASVISNNGKQIKYTHDDVYSVLFPIVYNKIVQDKMEDRQFTVQYVERVSGKSYNEVLRERAEEAKQVIKDNKRWALSVTEEAFKKNNSIARKGLAWFWGDGITLDIVKADVALPYDRMLDQIEAWEENDFASGFAANFDWSNVLSLGLMGESAEERVGDVYAKVEAGKELNAQEAYLFKAMQAMDYIGSVRNDIYEPQGVMSSIGGALGESTEELLTFILGSKGAGKALKALGWAKKSNSGYKAAKAAKAVKTAKGFGKVKAFGNYAYESGKLFAKNRISNFGRDAVQAGIATTISPSTYTRLQESWNEQYSINPDGSVTFTPKGTMTLYATPIVNQWAEYYSELWGAAFYDDIVKMSPYNLGSLLRFNRATKAGATATAALSPTKKKIIADIARSAGWSGSLGAEVTGEAYGDILSTAINSLYDKNANWESFSDPNYWLTLIGVSSVMGGGISVFNAPSQIKRVNYIHSVAQKRAYVLSQISDKRLRDRLTTLANSDPSVLATELANTNWESIKNPADKAYAYDFASLNAQVQVALGYEMEGTRLAKFDATRKEIESHEYKQGGKGTGLIVTAVDSAGNEYYVIEGNSAESESMLKCIDKKTGKKVAKIASDLTITANDISLAEEVHKAYQDTFSVEIETERLLNEYDALKSLEDPTHEAVDNTMAAFGIIRPKQGEMVTLTDGRQAKVIEDVGDGIFIVESVDAEGNPMTESISFTRIQSSDPMTAIAQRQVVDFDIALEEITKSQQETPAIDNNPLQPSEPIQATETPLQTPEVVQSREHKYKSGDVVMSPSGKQARVVGYERGAVIIDYNLDANAPVADKELDFVAENTLSTIGEAFTETATPAVSTSSSPTTEASAPTEASQSEEQVIERTKDGEIDYGKINNVDLLAKLLIKNFGGLAKALKLVKKWIANTDKQIKKIEEKAENATSPNEEAEAETKIRELTALKNKYEAARAIIERRVAEEQQQKKQEVKAKKHDHTRHPEAGLVRDENTATMDEGFVNLVDRMAKVLGVKVSFTDKPLAHGAEAQYNGNEVTIYVKARTKTFSMLLGHEMMHHMREVSPEMYEAFKNAIKDYMGEEAFLTAVTARVANYQAQGVPIDNELAAEEICADEAGKMVDNEYVFYEFLESVDKKNSRAQRNKFLRGLLKVVDYISDKVSKMGVPEVDTKIKKRRNALLDLLNDVYEKQKNAPTMEGKTEETTAETTKNEETTAEEAKGEDGNTNYSLQTINALSDALSEYNTNGDIASFVDAVRVENARFGGHPYLTNLIMDYEEDGNADWFAEKIKGVIGEDNEDYAPYTAGGVKFSLATDVASILEEYDTDGVKYGSILDVADGIEAVIAESTEDTTELENILDDFRAAQDDARRWGNRMDSGGEEEFEEALRAYASQGQPKFSLAGTEVGFILKNYDDIQDIATAVEAVVKRYPKDSGMLANVLSDYRQNADEEEFIQGLRTFAKYFGDKQERDRSEDKATIEETFGGIWIEDTEEFAKFVSAVTNSPFEEDGEGIAYTDNYFYAYYRNINGEPVPYASVYMNEAVSQDIVKKVIKEINDVRTSGRVKERIDSALERIRDAQSQDNANDGDNSGASSRRRNERLGFDILRKGRYFDNPSLYVKTSRTDGRGDVDYHYSLRETDPEILEQLNNGNTIKVYRAMQVIDGELYPPMSARVGGKLRAPIALGEWERAEERPDLADDKGYFKLDKGNSTSLKARYNPYIHTSLTPLNDQFSSAQDRPNLVTVEVEIPESELTSGYKADKAKDAVGKLEWKAGVVQSQLTGTRTVILSRWDRPIRIVPDSEVAQRIVEMFGDTKVIMPSNVVTPSLREELEELGVPFRETDNQGKSRYSLITPEMDASYLDAVERDDMETAQKMVMEAAEKAGYINDESWRMNHRAPRKDEENANPFNTEKIVPEDYWEHPEWYTNIHHSGERESFYAMKRAIDKYKRLMAEGKTDEAENVTITMYRGVDKTANKREATFRNGDWITPSRSYALSSAPYGKARVISQEVKLKDIWWDGNSVNEWGYDDGANYGYRDTKNNRKLLDPVTYDDNGNVIPLSERFNPRKEDIRYSLIGEKGAAMLDQADESMHRLENLEVARQMERAGKKATDIKLATGWERGADNLWRYEVEDFLDMYDEYGNFEKSNGTLQDYLDHEELFTAYPELRNINVEIVEPSKIAGYNGYYSAKNNKIVLAKRGKDDMARTLFHEVQHAIQYIEGFAEGGNPNMEDPIKSNENLHRIERLQKEVDAKEKVRNELIAQKDAVSDRMSAWFDAHEDVTMASQWDAEMKGYNREYDKLNTEIQKIQREITKANDEITDIENSSPKLGYEGYRRIAGEVEARSTASRVGMTWRERLNSLASEMEDIAPKDQIFLKGGIAYATEAAEEATRYSLSDIPFFDAEGNAIDMSAISEAKALEMIDGRVRDMMAYDYDKSVVGITNQAKKDRRATRAYYAEERRKRRGNNEAPRTNAAKIDELFADTNINSLPLEVQALIFIAEGRAKIRWADKDGKRGLASELGLANSASDKAAMKSVWSGAEQSFDEVVHGWWESINGYERGIDTQDLRNALIEALMSFPSAKAAMRELQTQYDAIATAEREALEEIERREAADLDRVKREYEERSARFEMSEGEERESMREMAVEHYSSQPLSAADEALEELTDKLNKMERRAERLMLDQKSGYRELAESIEKSKEVIIRTLEHLRMFSGMEQIHIDEVAKLINMTRTARSKRQVEAVATKAKNLIQRIAIRKARENMRRLLDLKLSNVEVIQQILKESNTLPREERDALLKSLWKVSRNGWRATKAVHPDTKEIFKELNDLIKEYKKNVKDKEVATISKTITDRLVSLEAELHPDVEVDDKGNVIDNAGLPTDFNDSNRNIALHLFKSYLEVEAKNVAYSEANKTLRETDKNSEKFGEALSDMYVAREDYLSALKQFNVTLEDVIVNGKDKLRDFNIEKEKHEVALRSMAIKAIGGKKASAQGKRGNALQLARAAYNISFNSPYWTFETVLERIDRLSPYKKGEFYNYFMRKYTDANAKLYTSYSAHMESIGSAMARCFPDMAKQFGIIGRNPYEIYKAVMRKAEATALGTLKYKEGGVEREMQLTVANAMYIVAMWRQPRYREAMEANGITEVAINNLMQSIKKEHAGYINFMDWVNTAFLPNTRLEYDEVYRKLNGGSLAKEENYFPARVVTHEDVKLDENGKGQLPSSPSALKERISHKQMPKIGTDYFKVLEAHIQDMDKWAAFAELTADLNVILSSDEFRRRLNEFMPGLGGDGGGKGSLYKMLYDTALIATGNYHSSGENVFGPIQKAWATSNIAFRLWTAVKQISSVSVGVTEHVYFLKHMLATSTVAGIAYEWERAMALSPSLRYRWQSKAAGMEALMRETSRGDGYAQYRGGVVKTYDALKDMADKAVKLGMTPNALVDAIACSILVNSVYDKAIHDMTKGEREATEEERKEAIRKAEIAFNSTQQSSEGAYLSAAQANPLYAPLTTYMNASFALHRKRMSGIHELWKLMSSKEYGRFLKDEYGVDAAKISAKDAFADIIRGIVGDLSFAAMGWGLMEVMSAVYEWLGGDGDEDDTEAEKQAFFETCWLPVFNGFLGGSQITSLFQGYDTSMTPAYDELLEDVGGIFDGKGDWRVEVAQAATKYGLGIDIKSLYRIGAGLENMEAEEKGENAGSILMFLNAPNKYIKAFVGDRREGETLQQYQTRIMRLYTLFDKVMYEELYDENGKYIGEGAPSMIMSQTQAKALNKEYEAAYLKDVVVRNGGWDEYRTMMSTEVLYKDICAFIGVTPDAQPSKTKLRNTVYSTGEYVAPVYGLSQKEHGELLSAESYVAGAHHNRTRWVGDDEGYYGLLKEEYRKKSELIDKYNEYIK